MRVLLVAAALVALVYSAAPASTTPILSGTIHLTGTVVEHNIDTTGLHRWPDREAWYLSLKSGRRAGRPFGYVTFFCAFVSRKSTLRQCAGTFSLPLGKISIAGSFLYPALYQLSVTGGTDAYQAVGGSVTFQQQPGRPGSYRVDITLR